MQFFARILRQILKLRYNIIFKGEELINKDHPLLIMPNHVGYIDPVILGCHLMKKIKISPVATNTFAESRWFKRIFKALNAIGVDDVDKNNTKNGNKSLSNTLSQLEKAIKKHQNIILFPSGVLAGQGYEYIGGKKAGYISVKNTDNKYKIIGVRCRGIWGSSWSNARNGEEPSLGMNCLKSIGVFFANLIFFVPKRTITIEFVDITEQAKKQANKELKDFNHFLEEFYNSWGEEAVSYIPYFFYYNNIKGKTLPKHIRNSVQSLSEKSIYQDQEFSPELIEELTSEILRIKEGLKKEEIWPSSRLVLDLYMDSLDMAELKNSILNTYPAASNTPISELKTLADLAAMAMGMGINQAEELKECKWIAPEGIQRPKIDPDKNILELFKEQVKKSGKTSVTYDNLLGLQSRKDFLIKALLISDYLKTIEGKHLGIMLPAISSTSLILIGSYLAEKIPVMLNWTHPQSAFDHCVQFSQTKKILTSKKFYDKLDIERLKNYEFIFLEDLLKKIPLQKKLKALVKSRSFTIPKLDPTAVVLYTSGSEALPKAVALTHENIVRDIVWALDIFHIQQDEILLGYLPPFHSFWFTVNTILPLIIGVRTVNTPDPNDSLTAAQLIQHTQATVLPTTPTFLKNLLNAAKPEHLTSLRYVVTGAEKCPPLIFEKFKKLLPHAKLLEGYGITECSPVISINPIKKQKAESTGIAVGGLEISIRHVEDNTLLKKNQEGMIFVKGPSVFEKYLDPEIESPFVEFEGEKRYKTGDLGYLDKDKYLYITGRLKRFIKIGGEMISLPFLENLFLEKRGNPEEINLAIEAKEQNGGAKIVLFTVDTDIDLKQANSYLKSKGVSNLIKLSEIRKIWSIPVLGTGKTDYKILKAKI